MKYFILFLSICFSSFAQHQDKVDFTRGEIYIRPNPEQKEIRGMVTYEFEVLNAVDSIFLDAKNMHFTQVQLNGKEVDYTNTGKIISIKSTFTKTQRAKLKVVYRCIPAQTVYFLGWNDQIIGNEQIWTQGQGKYTSYWLPSLDDMEEKMEFDLNFELSSDTLAIIANGVKTGTAKSPEGNTLISFNMKRPMSSYLLAFAVGKYSEEKLYSKSGVPIENYFYPQDSLRVEPTYRYTRQIFDFLEREIGVPYPWQNYKQIPVRDFLYAGMENTGTTIFSDGYVIDSVAFIDKNYVNVNAHEMAHQWFGNLVTETSAENHWLHEGFATFYAYLVEKEIFGDDHFYWTLFRSLNALKNAGDRGEGQSLLDPKANSLTFYEKGAWALFILREEIGEDDFQKGIREYLESYAFKNVTVANFIESMQGVNGKSLDGFVKKWLKGNELPYEEAITVLREKLSSFQLLGTLKNELKDHGNVLPIYLDYWNRSDSEAYRRYLLEAYEGALPDALIQRALASESILVRQSLIGRADNLSVEFKGQYESLLNDRSYVTQETALLKLWMSFPEDRSRYLDETAGILGLPNYNVRLLWLTLAIATQEYTPNKTRNYFMELTGYTSPAFSWEVRLGAFQYLRQIGLSDEGLMNLLQATMHHSWQFKKYVRNLLDELLEQDDYKQRIAVLSQGLKGEELRYIKGKLKK